MSNKLILSTYADVVDLIKTGLITDINSAISQGTLNIDENTTASLLALLDTLVTTYSANGYEQMQRVANLAVAKPAKKTRTR